MIPARQSTALELSIGPILDADGVAVTGGVVGDFKIKKTTGNFAALNGSATLTHVSAGTYDLVLTTSDTDTVGLCSIAIDDGVNACAPVYLQVMEEAVYDAFYAASALGYVANAPVTLADDAITAAKFDESTAFPLKSNDAGSTAVARVGADSDTLETLSDQLDGIAGNGKVVRAAHLGDLAEDVTLTFLFNTLGANNAPITLGGTPAVSVYKGNSTTQLAEAAALTVDLDSLTGTHAVTLDLSSDAFYATGENYTVVITTGTVDGDSVVGTVVGSFSIENRFDEVDVVALGGGAQSLLDLKDFADDGYNPATNKIAGVVLADTLTTYTGNTPQTGDSYAIVNSGTHGNAALKTLIDAISTAIGALNDLDATEVQAAAEAALAAFDGATATDTDALATAIAALNDLSAADVNAEVVDALATDTYAEPTGTPGATITLAAKISWLFMALRNPITITATDKTFLDDGGSAEWKKTLSDDGTTYTESEATTP
jgi:hypothetical protein